MGRPLRPIDENLIYHAINRGNNREVAFADDEDHPAFLHSLGRTQLPLRPGPGVSISRVLRSLTVAHTWRYHRRHHTVGHVWQGRFRSPVIQSDGNLWAVLSYIEANPLRARMVSDPATYRWSSYPAHGEGRADPLLEALPEWPDLGPDGPARQIAWRRKVRPDAGLGSFGAGSPGWLGSFGAGRPGRMVGFVFSGWEGCRDWGLGSFRRRRGWALGSFRRGQLRALGSFRLARTGPVLVSQVFA
jgi:putative transposase